MSLRRQWAVNAISLAASVLPRSATTLLLNPAQVAILDFDLVSGGTVRTDFQIPALTSLIGLHFFGQALILPAGGAPFYLTEPDAKRIQ